MNVGQCNHIDRDTIVSNDSTSVLERECSRPDRVAIPITLHNLGSLVSHVPFTFGVDMPRGMVTDSTRLVITDEHGRRPTVQQAITARWADGSAKWVLLDFSAESVPSGTSFWSISAAESADHPQLVTSTTKNPGVRVVGSVLEVDNSLCGSKSQQPVRIDFQLRNQHRDLRRLRVEDADWETVGTVRSTLRVEGTFARCRGLRMVARIHVYQQSGLVEVSARLHNPNRAKHKGGLWDLGDAGSILFGSFDVVISTPELANGKDKPTCWWQCEAESALRRDDSGGVTIYQDSSGGENWQSRIHVNRDGDVCSRFRGYRVTAGDEKWSGLRATPIVKVCSADKAFEVAVPEFWQQFPSAVEADAATVRVGMFPGQFGDLHELQGGEQKTHSFWLRISPDGTKTPAVKSLHWVHQRPRVTIAPEWHRATEAIPYFISATTDPDGFVASAAQLSVHGSHSLFARREIIDEYGWRNFGEMWADHEQPDSESGIPVISHYNNQFDVIYGGLLQMLRSGDPAWYDLWEPLARHVTDIDIYHTKMDRAAYNGGLFWHTDHYKTADRCTHRTYTAANQKPGHAYGGGPSDEHNYTTGLLHAYYLTGNPDFKDAVLSLANWVVNMDDGEQTVFSVASDGPTGLASATALPDYHGPGRGAGNSINALLDGWLITNDERYLRYAEVIIRRVVNPNDEIETLDLLNSELRWSYTVCLTALARYLHVKAEADDKDHMYAYTAYSLTHYGRWMTEHERPYLDRPEELEFPTETWAAQDLRKANVLRLAARYMSGRHRDAALQRGDEIAARARKDLTEFETSDLVRPLNLILTEGAKDSFMRTYGPGSAALCQSFEFVPPEGFEPQKQAAVRRLKSVSGACAVAGRMLDVRRWPRLLRAAIAR